MDSDDIPGVSPLSNGWEVGEPSLFGEGMAQRGWNSGL